MTEEAPYNTGDSLRHETDGDRKRGEALNVLHVERYPELIRYKGHVSESDAENAKCEGMIFPNGRVEEWKFVSVFPDGQGEDACDAKKKQEDNVE